MREFMETHPYRQVVVLYDTNPKRCTMFSDFRQLLYHFFFEDNAFILGTRMRVYSMNRHIDLPLQNNVTLLWRNGNIFMHGLHR